MMWQMNDMYWMVFNRVELRLDRWLKFAEDLEFEMI